MDAVEARASWAAHPAPDPNPIVRELRAHDPAGTITVILASARRTVHAAWLPRLKHEAGIELQGEPITLPTRLATCVAHHPPKVLLLDKAMLDGLDPQPLRTLREHCRHVRVLLLWDEICHGLVADVLRNRFHGFLLATSPPEVCMKAIRAVSKGELWLPRASLAGAVADMLLDHDDAWIPADTPPAATAALTPREFQIVELLRRGCSNKEIARELGIMEDTVKKHLQSVFAKLGVRRRTQVALRRRTGYCVTLNPLRNTPLPTFTSQTGS